MLLAVEELPDETREAILARADGNPLFLEEIIRQLIDEGRIVRDGGRWRATEDVDEIEIPDTVQAVLAARIDLLPPVERSALLSASVVGRVFWSGSVARLLDDGNGAADEALGRLEDRELVLSQLGSRIAGEREFLFKHVLTRDVAYGTLRAGDRARAHADVAAWIESAAGRAAARVRRPARTPSRARVRRSRRRPGAPADRRDELRRRSSKQAWLRPPRRRAGCCSTRRTRSARPRWTSPPTRTSVTRPGALGLSALRDYRGDDAWRNLSQAVDERIAGGRASGEDLAMLCARAVESPTRWPASMVSTAGTRSGAAYVEIGLEHAASDGEARVRLLLARSMWVFAFRREGFTEEDAETARRRATRRSPSRRRSDATISRARRSTACERRVHRRPARADAGPWWNAGSRSSSDSTDPWEVGDAMQTAADTALAIGRYDDARRWASEGFERARAARRLARGLAWRAIARFKLGDWDGAIEDFERMEAARATTRFGTSGTSR